MIDVARLLESWPLAEPVAIAPTPEQGDTSQSWLVDAGGERFVAKLIHDGRRYAEPGLRVALAVDRGGVPTGAPILTRIGDLCLDVAVGERGGTLALLHFVLGEPLDPGAREAPEVAGALLGRVHAILARDSARDWVPNDLLDWAEWHAAANSAVDRARVAAVLQELTSLRRGGALTSAVVYGDPSPEILVDQASGAAALIDWGTPSWGPLLHDVACWTAFVRAEKGDRHDRFLAAYRQVVPLDDAELGYLPRFWQLAHALRLTGAAA